MEDGVPATFWDESSDAVRLYIRVLPKARRDSIEGIERDGEGRARLKIRVTAPPEKGAANARVIALLSKSLHIAPSRFAVRRGAEGRLKTLEISERGEELKARLKALVGEG